MTAARRLRLAALTCVPLAAAGCLGDAAATRTLTLHQSQSTTAPADVFDVDTTQLPDWAVHRHTEADRWGNKTTHIEFDRGVPVRVLIVPATRPAR